MILLYLLSLYLYDIILILYFYLGTKAELILSATEIANYVAEVAKWANKCAEMFRSTFSSRIKVIIKKIQFNFFNF